jgi:hypothetical protein
MFTLLISLHHKKKYKDVTMGKQRNSTIVGRQETILTFSIAESPPVVPRMVLGMLNLSDTPDWIGYL